MSQDRLQDSLPLTATEAASTVETSAETKESPSYAIDRQWYQERDRSFVVVALSRMCPSCRHQFEVKSEPPRPSKKKGKSATASAIGARGQEPFTVFENCCGTAEDFLRPDLPLLEAIFRLFLARGNRPLTAEEISEQLRERWGGVTKRRDLSPSLIRRVMDGDEFYGLRPVASKESPKEPAQA